METDPRRETDGELHPETPSMVDTRSKVNASQQNRSFDQTSTDQNTAITSQAQIATGNSNATTAPTDTHTENVQQPAAPAASTSTASSLLTDLSELPFTTPTTPKPTPKHRRTMPYDTPLPKLGRPGEVEDWLIDFDEAMVERECYDNEEQAKKFRVCLKPGSQAKAWYDKQKETTKKDITLLLDALNTSFKKDQGNDKWWKKLKQMKLTDEQALDEDERNDFVDECRIAAAKVSDKYAAPQLKANLIISNMGRRTYNQIKSNIEEATPTGVLDALQDLGETELALIEEEVEQKKDQQKLKEAKKKDAEDMAEMKAELERIKRELKAKVANTPSTFNRRNASNTDTTLTVLAKATRDDFLDVPESHQKKIQQYIKSYGDKYSTEWKFPLMPGTEDATGKECFKCGKSGHYGRNCTNKAVPLQEQAYRSCVRRERFEKMKSSFRPTVMQPTEVTMAALAQDPPYKAGKETRRLIREAERQEDSDSENDSERQ
ncbi:hypothetical protein QFC22_006318 [Naganishia vaughanmartiniae]|uniref:Uncharacterized protein n=1 Tax=Naganishia vaughanmartiniae TaxID=1424756 RepID=A0ACC2WLY1_9TREE|nr:hypothetical protein QFC22_006318 [Naganishia vaughanmartiniae]